MDSKTTKKILIAPLNWGLGHATRCIPIVNALIQNKYEPIIASDGEALTLLRKEFPRQKHFELPSYNITYSKKGSNFKRKLIKDSPHLLKTIKNEKKAIKEFVESENISGIISDNRFGVRHKDVPSVFITHQLKVLSGNTTWLSTKLHQKIISKFDECWVPDHGGENNLSGALGHCKFDKINVKYIGPLSRFNNTYHKPTFNLMVLLSGPEPQRTYLENKLLKDLESYTGKVIFVRGKFEAQQQKDVQNNITIYNYMTSGELEDAINKSDLVLSRSGYTTIMDLAKLQKRAFFIPTPGQFEQEYLAKILYAKGITPYSHQDNFKIEMLNTVSDFTGFKTDAFEINYRKLFSLF
ncbi:glycosyltransferase [Winogradskyella alexanderae]|uniref:Glycosyltransferase n=1 Tax=Winogradskyella alexanderae TaxID=2877123 RepID=A0ABS7XNJ1_9FLAO|nr:glycosyltransferase [Winogradskyella alexanderae]MCA0131551.1 glycosyltransferase [Winogradskyella alexanderae]